MVFRFRSFRTKLQTAFLALGFAAIGVTGWEASQSAADALQDATYNRLTAIAESRRQQVERYFAELANHVLALSSDEATIQAIEGFRAAWDDLPASSLDEADAEQLRGLYASLQHSEDWIPRDPRARRLQHLFLAGNPYPIGEKNLLLAPERANPYGRIHARFHPTLDRYRGAFGFYDIFLIDAETGRLLYTVFKEIDFAASLNEEPHSRSTLASAFRRALGADEFDQIVIEDFAPYAPSHQAPAAFLAAPIRRAGGPLGVLAIQVSIDQVNRVMTAGRDWRAEGLGDSGQAYAVGSDGLLRSDTRADLESLEESEPLLIPETAILRLHAPEEVISRLEDVKTGGWTRRTEPGVGWNGESVLRSMVPLAIPGLNWVLVAEISSAEALAPIHDLRIRVLVIGLVIAALFVAFARFLASSVTRPVLSLAAGAGRLGALEFGARAPVESNDEIGELAASFNRMAENLERATVSRDRYEALSRRLISAQEDERARLARELHDDFMQRLAAVSIDVGALARSASTDPAVVARIERIKAQVASLSSDIHSVSRSLHPKIIGDLGLVAAIESECRASFERGGPPVRFSADGLFDNVPLQAQVAVYRIVQECLRNVHRHADADEVRIDLTRTSAELILSVADDGRGLSPDDLVRPSGLGLASMEERVRLLGGRFAVRSAPGAGVSVEARLPFGASQGNESREEA